jgi:hypothetical protein
MFLRFLSILLFVYSFGNAVELYKKSNMYDDHPYLDGNIDVRIQYDYNNVDDFSKKDWIAIYKKGASVEWKNVIVWSWVKDLPSDLGGGYTFFRKKLPVGAYEARFFKNNSYTVDKFVKFTIKKSDSYLEKINVKYKDNTKSLSVNLQGLDRVFKPTKKDWMAIYRVGSSNEWKNVLKWTWVSDISVPVRNNSYSWKVNNLNLPEGKYEVRYFLNNTYSVYKKSDYFSIVKNNNMARLDDVTLEYEHNQHIEIKFYDTASNKKDWIAIFKKGAKKIAKNVLVWKYNSLGQKSGTFYIHTNLQPGEYESVLFSNDSYKIIATSKLVITNNVVTSIQVVKGMAYPREMVVSIKNHANAFKKDWVAIFRYGKPHTKENILAWSYTEAKNFVILKAFKDNKYTAVLFSNDSYNEIDSYDFEF